MHNSQNYSAETVASYHVFTMYWLRSTVGRSSAGELTLSCTRPAADGWPLCG